MAAYSRDFRGLDRQDRMQRTPFGESSSLNPSPVSGVVGQQYRRQQEDYNTAMRILRRQGRRGDASSAIGAIKLRDQANAAGFSPGGIRQHDEFNAGIAGRAQSLEQGAMDRERAQQLDRTLVDEELGAVDAGDDLRRPSRRLAGGGYDADGFQLSRPTAPSAPFVTRGNWWDRNRR